MGRASSKVKNLMRDSNPECVCYNKQNCRPSLSPHLCGQGDRRAAMVVPAFVKLEPLREVDLRNVIFAPFLFPVFPEYIPGIKWTVPPVPLLAAVRTSQAQCEWTAQHYQYPSLQHKKIYCFHLFRCRTFIMVACSCNKKETKQLSSTTTMKYKQAGIETSYMYCQVHCKSEKPEDQNETT